jgi:hypothetical protein
VSALLAALAAYFAVYQASESRKNDLAAKRPYISVKEPGIKPLPTSPPYRIQITMINAGMHPADELVAKLIITDQSLDRPPTLQIAFSIGNEIPTDSPTPWYNDSLKMATDVPPQFIVLGITYRDPILDRRYQQIYTMRWDGVTKGSTHPDFTHVSREERNQILDHLHSELREFL